MTTLLVIRKEIVQKCVVYGCSNTKDEKKGISIHTIPFFNDSRPEAVKRRRKWISFVNATRKNWTASKHSVICSVHFSPEDFSRLFFEGQKYQQRLKKDEIGVTPIPSTHIVKATEEETNRHIRMKRRELMKGKSSAKKSAASSATDQHQNGPEEVQVERKEDDKEEVVVPEVLVTRSPGQKSAQEGSRVVVV